jgi:hypothetical protein
MAATDERVDPVAQGKADGGVQFIGGAAPAVGVPAAPPAAEKPQPRKVIYTGDVALLVEDIDQAEEAFLELIKEHDGYIARSDIQGQPNQPRRGSWTVRIPSAKSSDFLKALSKLGELQRSSLDSKDITDQYFDMQAALTNLEAEERAIRKLYDEKIASTKLGDLMEVRRELARVRGEINVMKGQLQRWDKEVAFTTFTVALFDRRNYIPPTAPLFGTTVSRTFGGSLAAMEQLVKVLILIVVALTPWLVVMGIIGVPLWFVYRHRKSNVPPPPVPVAEPPAPAANG